MKRRVALAVGAAVLAGSMFVAPAASAATTAPSEPCALGEFGRWLHLPGCDGPTPLPVPTGVPPVPDLPLPGVPIPAPPAPESPPPADTPVAEPDPGAPVFTADPPVLSGSALSLRGLRDIRVVEVRHADGTVGRALRLSADEVVVEGFHLDVPSGHGGLRNDSARMIATGHVVVYADSIRGILATGAEVLVDTLTAPPSPETLAQLTRLHIPLVGMTADSVTHVQSHQQTYAD